MFTRLVLISVIKFKAIYELFADSTVVVLLILVDTAECPMGTQLYQLMSVTQSQHLNMIVCEYECKYGQCDREGHYYTALTVDPSPPDVGVSTTSRFITINLS